MKKNLATLQKVLKEYLELGDADIAAVVSQVQDEWYRIMALHYSDKDAAEIMQDILGVPDWTKKSDNAPVV